MYAWTTTRVAGTQVYHAGIGFAPRHKETWMTICHDIFADGKTLEFGYKQLGAPLHCSTTSTIPVCYLDDCDCSKSWFHTLRHKWIADWRVAEWHAGTISKSS